MNRRRIYSIDELNTYLSQQPSQAIKLGRGYKGFIIYINSEQFLDNLWAAVQAACLTAQRLET